MNYPKVERKYPKELTNTYEIYEEIGAGGGGTVYRALHKRLQKMVVLKKLKGSATSIMDCRTEVDILKKLSHSYLPQVLDFIESPEGIFTVMDFIPGKSLQKMLDEKHQFTEKEVLKYTRQLCEVLDYLHSKNPPIVHGDIKPDNIMITPEGNVCLIDFNISGILEGKGAITFGYTPGFSAPEQVIAFEQLKQQMQTKHLTMANRSMEEALSNDDKTILFSPEDETILIENGEEKTVVLKEFMEDVAIAKEELTSKSSQISGISIDKRSDIYSLGATIYTLLTGKLREPKDKNLVLTNVSSGFSVVLAKALAYEPNKRYQDAGSMLKEVREVHKKDKKYKRLLHRQEATFVILFLLIASSVYSIFQGKNQMAKEKEENYEQIIKQLEVVSEDMTAQTEFEQLYGEAVTLFPEYLDAYYLKAYYLYETDSIETTMHYLEEVLSIPVVENNEISSNLYYLYGECYFQKEDYLNAEFYYERAIILNPSNAEMYRDYAITLIYLEKLEEAKDVLETAISYGMIQAHILMVRGELARISGEYEKALECFDGVFKETKDDYMWQRASVMASKSFEAIGTKEAYLEDIKWLTISLQQVELTSRMLLYERLVQDYIAVGELTKENSYYEQAIEVLKEIITMNWDNYLTYNNAIILCQRMGKLDEATTWVQEMEQKYSTHYITYVRFCYLEIEKQNQKDNIDRNYEAFVEYYEKAKQCYEKQVAGNVTNAEMLQLEQLYQQMVDGGWLD